MNNEAWLERLELLISRFSHLGVSDDIASLSLVEAWGLYRYLDRLAFGG